MQLLYHVAHCTETIAELIIQSASAITQLTVCRGPMGTLQCVLKAGVLIFSQQQCDSKDTGLGLHLVLHQG